MRKIIIPFIIIVFIVDACAPKPFSATNKSYKYQSKQFMQQVAQLPTIDANDSIKQPSYFIGTTNFNLRKPSYVIIHHTAQNSCEQTLKTFTTTASKVSAHYVICKDGTVHHMLNDYYRAWHAGISRWGNQLDINSASIGIELDNNGFEPFDTLQINSLISLLGKLKKEYGIPTANFIGHGDIAPTRKNDPNYRFPWKVLADKGFGIWYDAVRDTLPSNFNHIIALRIIGYDIKDTTAAVMGFKRHFMQDSTKRLTDIDKNVLNNLYKKYL
jgi:N-acetylmuramoyl-L-alanine amidase